MGRWTVRVVERRTYEVSVRAASYTDAMRVAECRPVPPGEPSRSYYPVRMNGEPWASSQGWYMDVPVVMVERAHGHEFTAGEVALLRSRLEAMGVEVAEQWNGAGCGTVSFRAAERPRPLTRRQLRALVAPRPPDLAP